jgi:type 1 glutamine amidotransferase
MKEFRMSGAQPKALIVAGGWEGHEPRQVAKIFADSLRASGIEVTVSETLDSLCDGAALQALDLIVPIWTMSTITRLQLEPLLAAVAGGVGLGGCHGGMCDAFRDAPDYQFMTGGQWVAHPGNDGVEHGVRIVDGDHFITQGTGDFTVSTEHYYMHVDPVNRVLATTRFPVADGPHVPNGPADMPVVWTKLYGQGRVFYNSLGHSAAVVSQPDVLRLCLRGMLWAAHQEERAPAIADAVKVAR